MGSFYCGEKLGSQPLIGRENDHSHPDLPAWNAPMRLGIEALPDIKTQAPWLA
jgi:hypothetical protein